MAENEVVSIVNANVSLIQAFRDELDRILDRVRASVQFRLARELTFDQQGRVEWTPQNQVRLRRIDGWLESGIQESGYNALLNGFVRTFPGMLVPFRTTLRSLGEQLDPPLALDQFDFSAADRKALEQAQQNGRLTLQTAMDQAVSAIRQKFLLQIGAVPFVELAELISKQFRIAARQSETLAATAISTYYRTMNARAMAQIEKTQPPNQPLRYRYYGPRDKFNRPFCRRLLDAAKTYTQSEIQAMDNDSLPNPWFTGGGYGCRHAWILAVA